ncbi:hypothetical protein V5E97_13115 [Singulisphaera sp. Ch08]|uniref:DUF3828 domain-containing protein n=1 Tax=Singulisphaera sp. Ch08 TaxID=3120278 RepID=A0AAU7CNA1_9BACT
MPLQLLLLAAACGAFSQEPHESKADRDHAVINVVLEDMFSNPNSFFHGSGPKRQLFFSATALTRKETLTGSWKKKDKLTPIENKRAHEATEELLGRLMEEDAFKGLKLSGPRCILWDKVKDDALRDAGKPNLRPRLVQAYAPGYSKDHRLAVVRLMFPWGKHSANGTFVLVRKEGVWTVQNSWFNHFL